MLARLMKTCFSGLLILVILLLEKSYGRKHNQRLCVPVKCGNIDVSYPFWLRDGPPYCGSSSSYELVCEKNITTNNSTLLTYGTPYLPHHKYRVMSINYPNNTIHLVNTFVLDKNTYMSINCSRQYALEFNTEMDILRFYPLTVVSMPTRGVTLLSCQYPVNKSFCVKADHNCGRYTYVIFGRYKASDVAHNCSIDLVAYTSMPFKDNNHYSLQEVQLALLYGFEASFYPFLPDRIHVGVIGVLVIIGIIVLAAFITGVSGMVAHANGMILSDFNTNFRVNSNMTEIKEAIGVLGLAAYITVVVALCYAILLTLDIIIIMPSEMDNPVSRYIYQHGPDIFYVLECILAAKYVIGMPILFGLLVHKFRRRHMSVFDVIEHFLKDHNNLVPIRYAYSDIKKMTRQFRDKLGQGGYGSVYKGKLRSGHDVAVKVLTAKSKSNGTDFMNEVATIGRIHHANVVKLVGYCAEGSKRALLYDFMPNGSLEKYILRQETTVLLNWEKKYDIAVGVARGIGYLHRGCDIQILHFDIKPHNILLDDNFNPKISDFGLAKIFSADKDMVTLTAARGTIGYVAPELINKSIGGVSHKADVYSFGMMMIEMVGLKRDLVQNGDSSQYFPYWIYSHLEQWKDIETGNADGEIDDVDAKITRKMAIVALWCIQMSPDDRPAMSKVLEMLEGEVDSLQIPPQPSYSPEEVAQTWGTDTTYSSTSLVV